MIFPVLAASKSASISAEGFFVSRETTTISIEEKMNAGRSSYIPNTPPIGAIRNFQINTIELPPSIPAMAPAMLVLFQKREKSISGPKVAPKPAQAKDTMVNITLFSSRAIRAAMTAISARVILETHITCLSVASFLIIPWKIFFDTEEDAIRR